MKPALALLLSFSILLACKPLPKKKLSQFKLPLSYKVENDSLKISINNTLACPLSIKTISKDTAVEKLLRQDFPSVFPPMTDSSFVYPAKGIDPNVKIRFASTFGDPDAEIKAEKIAFPFPKGKKVKIIQGYNGSYSHNSAYSRYAIDFELKIGDTICAVADAWVIGVIEGYKYGGSSRKWRDYANFISLYHPQTHLYTQYVHLDHEGSLVEVGDEVKAGQAIGISGMTGFTDIEHLHFNVLKAIEGGMESAKVEFENGIKGEDLKKGMSVGH